MERGNYMNGTAEQVMKHSLLYSFIASQPFAVYVDAYPALENKLLIEENAKLKYGEHGNIVRLLQHKLSKLSYYDDPIDGDFDIITEHALKKFQKDFDIDVTGHADPHTIHAIIKSEKKKLLSKVEKLSESIYPGMHGEDVKIVQESLQYFGYYEGEIDGIYGPLTEKGLEIAESEHDIELTNKISSDTLVELHESEAQLEEEKVKSSTEKKEKDAEINQNEAEKKNEEAKTVDVQSTNNSDIIETAQSLIGTPYVWGGDSPGGFDCSGFINYIYSTHDITIPRTVNEVWNFSQHVDSPSIGDLVFFETYKPGPSHMGIYIGDGKFIHAGESRGVETSELNNPYWKDKYIGAKRIN